MEKNSYLEFGYNSRHISIYMTFVVLIGCVIGYGFGNTNNLQPTFDALYDWESPREQAWNNSYIGSSYLFGAAIGATVGGKMISKGRRLAV